MQSLAVKYRPTTFDSVTGQSEVKTILQNQIDNHTIKNAYLFCGGAGTGKTTCARIFANMINDGNGSPIELDAASNNSVDDVREIIQQAKTKSLESDYKIFILDEVHALSNNAWQAMLKLLEEPPEKSVFIMCTTDPQKIPKTILSRVQRFQFQRISQTGIVDRLGYIVETEMKEHKMVVPDEALEYIAKVADGGMRDAITMLDKCLAYSNDLCIENVVKALGLTDYDIMFKLTDAICNRDSDSVIKIIESIYADGKDLKIFIKSYSNFMLDLCKYAVTRSYNYVQIPRFYNLDVKQYSVEMGTQLLDILIKLSEQIKWDTSPKALIESTLLLECLRG